MDTWTEQMNYPVVMVTKIGGNIRLQQKRFLQNKRANETGKYTSRYGQVIVLKSLWL
ncbi:hypothetical protein DPMN_005037 [Dreissena polymorpha]|uniref:Uncharacterized protein n=1 Tax=Dreissena polymorpha TaxID=45954 RepID=A0A9D4RW45_DREPO|nr:hypothetical protein DPMN_005037 [Dreissena polymorpha]